MGKRTQDILSPTEAINFLAAIEARHLRVYVAARLMLELGLRLNEARSARWGWLDDLEHPGATITIPAAAVKTKYPRTLPLPDELRGFLGRLKKRQIPGDLIMPADGWPLVINRNGAIPSRRYIQRTIRETAITAINRPIRPHTLRHTFATRLLQRSNLRIVQLALGHRSIRSTERYTHPQLQDLRSAIEAMNSPESARVA